jgi:hypothetical protein
MKTRTLVLFAAAQMFAANFVSAQMPSATQAPLTPQGSPSFGQPNLSEALTRLLLLRDTQKAQIQPYLDAVQPQLDAIHQQANQSENALLRQLDASIRRCLDPEQQTKLDAYEAIRAAEPPSNPAGVDLIFGKGFGVSQ